MTKRRIESTTSLTAEMTCISRAVSYLETNGHYHSNDHIAVWLLPTYFRAMVHVSLFRLLFRRIFAPTGIYEYIIARTKYIDSSFKKALAESFDQILLLGAGFDTRALRFQKEARRTHIYELDASPTQRVKLWQYKKLGLDIPSNVEFIAIDFDTNLLSSNLDTAGFRKDSKSLFILEGLIMYLNQKSANATFQTIQSYAGAGSWIVFDYVQASVIRNENTLYGETEIKRSVSKAGEQWQFGIEPNEINSFLSTYGFRVLDHMDSKELERIYFQGADGRLVGRLNGTHCIVSAIRR